jgi:hypothetical protein
MTSATKAVMQVHREIELGWLYIQASDTATRAKRLIPYYAPLKAKISLLFYVLLKEWDIAFGSPRRVGLTASSMLH